MYLSINQPNYYSYTNFQANPKKTQVLTKSLTEIISKGLTIDEYAKKNNVPIEQVRRELSHYKNFQANPKVLKESHTELINKGLTIEEYAKKRNVPIEQVRRELSHYKIS